MTASIVYIWYLVVAGPGGGMAITPSAFDTREDCFAAIEEYRKGPTSRRTREGAATAAARAVH